MKWWFAWCTSSYSAEIHSFLKEKELKRPKILFRSPQASSRLDLVDWIRKVAESFKCTVPVVHLAVYILDIVMDTHNIAPERAGIGTVPLVCLWIASKYEHSVHGPRLRSLIAQSVATFRHEIDLAHAVVIERFVLNVMHYRLEWPTAAHFAEYYRLFAVVKGDKDSRNKPHSQLSKTVQLSFDIFLDRSLQFVDLVNLRPSHVAAGCLLAARIINVVSPAWPDSLRKVTRCSFIDVRTVANFLMSLSEPNSDCDSGYSSSPNFRLVKEELEKGCADSPTS